MEKKENDTRKGTQETDVLRSASTRRTSTKKTKSGGRKMNPGKQIPSASPSTHRSTAKEHGRRANGGGMGTRAKRKATTTGNIDSGENRSCRHD